MNIERIKQFLATVHVYNIVRLDRLLLLRLEVSANKELKKEEQITSVHDKRCRVVLFFNAAGWVRLVVVKTEQGHNNTHHHLRDLKDGNDHGIEPLGAKLHGHQKVIAIHGSMYAVVHHNEKDSGRRGCHVRMPAVQENSNMVVPMQEDERLFVDDNEEGVNELTVVVV
jgi:hypothetical protein